MLFQAIEGFALMVKKTAQALQSFGTDLAETELPNEIQATTVLLSTHTNKRDKMKVTESGRLSRLFYLCIIVVLDLKCCLCLQEDLLVALGQGSRLLESINEPIMHNPDHNMNQDELENLATVQRLERSTLCWMKVSPKDSERNTTIHSLKMLMNFTALSNQFNI